MSVGVTPRFIVIFDNGLGPNVRSMGSEAEAVEHVTYLSKFSGVADVEAWVIEDEKAESVAKYVRSEKVA